MKHRHSYSNHDHHHHQPPPQPPPQTPFQPHYTHYENTLLNEVLYLHSLWHRGPPLSHSTHAHLRPTHTTHFKKPQPRHVSDKDWSVAVTTQSSLSVLGAGWPAFPSQNKSVTRPATAEERASVLGVKIQQRGLDFTRSLFKNAENDDDDVEDDDDDEDVEDENDGVDDDEIRFFEGLFENDKELSEFYKRNCEGIIGREFYCLICGAIRGNNCKLGRKYKNCAALIQHSISVSKTKKRKAHRAFGNVVCKLLGWNVDRLPSFSDPVAVLENEVKNHANEDSAVVEMERDAAPAKPSQIEMETIPDAHQKDNVTSTDDGSIAIEQMQVEGEIKTLGGEITTAVEMEGDAVDASQSQAEPADDHNAFEKDNCARTDFGRVASALTHSGGEKDSSDGCKLDTQDTEKDRVCSNSETAAPEQENNPELDREDGATTVGEGCSELGSKPVECELSAGNDPFEQLQCLSGVFQIPE